MSEHDKLRLERELAKPGTYGESKVRVREWDLATHKQSYDELMDTAKTLREKNDMLAEELASFDCEGESLADKVRYWHELWTAQVDSSESFMADAKAWRDRCEAAATEFKMIRQIIRNSRTAPNVLDTIDFVAERGESAVSDG